MVNFVPDKTDVVAQHVPFFEDQKDAKIPGRGTSKTPEELQTEIRNLMTKMGAYNVIFIPGRINEKPLRYGYQITFMLANNPGRFEVAALPMRSEIPSRKIAALAQALYLVRNWIESEVFSQIYRPGNVPLLPYLVGPGDKTVTEVFISSGMMFLPVPGNN